MELALLHRYFALSSSSSLLLPSYLRQAPAPPVSHRNTGQHPPPVGAECRQDTYGERGRMFARRVYAPIPSINHGRQQATGPPQRYALPSLYRRREGARVCLPMEFSTRSRTLAEEEPKIHKRASRPHLQRFREYARVKSRVLCRATQIPTLCAEIETPDTCNPPSLATTNQHTWTSSVPTPPPVRVLEPPSTEASLYGAGAGL